MVKLVLPLHGIRTRAEWQRAFADEAMKKGWKCPLNNWHYGVFSIFQFVNPFARFAKVKWFRKRYTDVMNEYQREVNADDARPSIVAHSFGTYILGYSLLRYNNIKFDKVVLCGSILPRDFPWDELIERGQVNAVRNDVGAEDFWAWVCGFVIPGTGPSGSKGFARTHQMLRRYEHNLTHSEFFESSWMQNNWMPFLEASFTAKRATQNGRIAIPKGDHPFIVKLVWLVLFVAIAAGGVEAYMIGRQFFSQQHAQLRFEFDSDPPNSIQAAIQYSGFFSPDGAWKPITVNSGERTITLPWHARRLDFVAIEHRHFRVLSKGPFELDGAPITIDVVSSIVGPDRARGMPGLFTMDSLPTRRVAGNMNGSKKPSSVKFHYRNGTGKDFSLFVLDITLFYMDGRQDYWQVWPFPASEDFEAFGAFQEPSKGAFYFVARELESGIDTPLGCFQLFEHDQNYLVMTMRNTKPVAQLRHVKP